MTELKNYAFIHDYPLFQQLMNACGLTSILMIFGKDNQQEIQDQLKKMREMLSPLVNKIVPDLPEEFFNQYVLQYLVLKIYAANSDDYNFLAKYFQEYSKNILSMPKKPLKLV